MGGCKYEYNCECTSLIVSLSNSVIVNTSVSIDFNTNLSLDMIRCMNISMNMIEYQYEYDS